jgi:DNA invertase Pin-like site-specific DNA recombinase
MTTTRKRAAIYSRVSTTGQTIENQRRELERVAQQRGWEIVELYEDAGLSGAKGRDQRPALDRLHKELREVTSISSWRGRWTGLDDPFTSS